MVWAPGDNNFDVGEVINFNSTLWYLCSSRLWKINVICADPTDATNTVVSVIKVNETGQVLLCSLVTLFIP